MQRIGEPRRRDVRYRHRPGAYAIALVGDGVLLTMQDGAPPELQLPGGGVDPGEAPIAALHREVLEETGWRIAAPRRVWAYRHFRFMPDYGIWAEKVCTVYLARAVRPLHPPHEPGHAALVVPLDMAPDLVGPEGDAEALDRVLIEVSRSRRTGRRRPRGRR